MMGKTTSPLPSGLIAAVAALTLLPPNSSSSTNALFNVLDERDARYNSLPSPVFAYIPIALATFFDRPALGDAPLSLARASELVRAFSEALMSDAFLTLVTDDSKISCAARRGLYAIFCLTGRDTRMDMSSSALKLLRERSAEALCHFLRSDTGLLKDPHIIAEVYEACHDDLSFFLEKEELFEEDHLYQSFAMKAVAVLVGTESWPQSPIGVKMYRRAFGAGSVASVLRWSKSDSLRALWCDSIALLCHLLQVDAKVDGIASVLKSAAFLEAVNLVRQELISLSTGSGGVEGGQRSTPQKSGPPSWACKPFSDEVAQMTSLLLLALRRCPLTWTVVSSVTKRSPYSLFALAMRLPFERPVASICQYIWDELEEHRSHGNLARWTSFVKTDFYESGCYAALLTIFKRPQDVQSPGASHHFWYSGGALLAAFANILVHFERSFVYRPAVHPGSDPKLVEALVSNITELSSFIASVGKGVACEDVLALTALLDALRTLSLSSSPEIARSGMVRSTKPVLMSLITLNAVVPELIVRPNRSQERPGPNLEMCMGAFGSIFNFVCDLANGPAACREILAHKGAIAAIVASTCFAWNAVSGRDPDRKRKSRAAFIGGVTSLADLTAINCTTSKQIVAAVFSNQPRGMDIVRLMRSIVSKALWDHSEASSDVLLSEQRAAILLSRFFVSVSALDPSAGPFGWNCAVDETLVRGVVEAVTMGIASRNQDSKKAHASLSAALGFFNRLAASVVYPVSDFSKHAQSPSEILQVTTAKLWFKLNVFSSVCRAANCLADVSVAFYAVYHLLLLAVFVKGHGDEICKTFEFRLGHNALLELKDGGAAEFVKIYGSKYLDGTELYLYDILFGELKGSRAKGAKGYQKEGMAGATREVPGSLTGFGMNPSSGLKSMKALAESVKGERGNAANLSARTCSSWKCSAGQSPSQRLKTCPCKLVVYCSKECQRADWAMHKLTCVARKSS